MPPPPAQITTLPFSSSQLIGLISKIRFGRGLGTTASPSGAMLQPVVRPDAVLSRPQTGPIGLLGAWKAGSCGSTSTWVSRVAKGNLERQQVAQLLLDDVADHALGFGPKTSSG